MKKKTIIVILLIISHAGGFYLVKKFFFAERVEAHKVDDSIEISNEVADQEEAVGREKEKSKLLIKAEEYLRMDKYDKAIECCREILEFDPESDRAYYGIGMAYYGTGDSTKAIENLNKAIDLNDSNFDSYYALAGVYRNENRHEEAIKCLERAIEIKPAFPNARFALGVINFNSGNVRKAVENFKEVVRLSPSDVEAYVNLGKAYVRINEINKAHESFRRAVQMCKYIDPEYAKKIEKIFDVIPEESMADRYYTDGMNFLKSKQINEAMRHFEKAIYYSKDSDKIFAGYAYREIGKIYIKQRRFEEAVEILNSAIEIVSDDADAYTKLGDAYAALSDADKAEESYEKAYEFYSSHGKKGRAKMVLLHKLSKQ